MIKSVEVDGGSIIEVRRKVGVPPIAAISLKDMLTAFLPGERKERKGDGSNYSQERKGDGRLSPFPRPLFPLSPFPPNDKSQNN